MKLLSRSPAHVYVNRRIVTGPCACASTGVLGQSLLRIGPGNLRLNTVDHIANLEGRTIVAKLLPYEETRTILATPLRREGMQRVVD
jgi:hypothetical protein